MHNGRFGHRCIASRVSQADRNHRIVEFLQSVRTALDINDDRSAQKRDGLGKNMIVIGKHGTRRERDDPRGEISRKIVATHQTLEVHSPRNLGARTTSDGIHDFIPIRAHRFGGPGQGRWGNGRRRGNERRLNLTVATDDRQG